MTALAFQGPDWDDTTVSPSLPYSPTRENLESLCSEAQILSLLAINCSVDDPTGLSMDYSNKVYTFFHFACAFFETELPNDAARFEKIPDYVTYEKTLCNSIARSILRMNDRALTPGDEDFDFFPEIENILIKRFGIAYLTSRDQAQMLSRRLIQTPQTFNELLTNSVMTQIEECNEETGPILGIDHNSVGKVWEHDDELLNIATLRFGVDMRKLNNLLRVPEECISGILRETSFDTSGFI